MNKLLSALVIVVLTLSFTACSKDTDGVTIQGKSFIRVINGVPNGGALDVKFNGSTVANIGAYGLGSTYIEVNAGTLGVLIRSTTANTDVLNTNLTVPANGFYTIVLADSLNKVKTSYLTDDPTPASGKAKVNMLHLGTAAGTVNFTTPATTVTLSNNRSFNDHFSTPSVADYINLDGGSFTIEARTPGTSGPTGIISTATQALQAGKSYTFVYRNPVAPSTVPSFTFIAN
jgi:hypothetical protein